MCGEQLRCQRIVLLFIKSKHRGVVKAHRYYRLLLAPTYLKHDMENSSAIMLASHTWASALHRYQLHSCCGEWVVVVVVRKETISTHTQARKNSPMSDAFNRMEPFSTNATPKRAVRVGYTQSNLSE